MQRRRIQVLLDDTTLTPCVAGVLERIDAEPVITSLSDVSGCIEPAACDARLVLTDQPIDLASRKWQELVAWFDRDPCATLILTSLSVDSGIVPASAFGARPIGVAGRLSTDELAGRLSAMCSFRPCLDQVRNELVSARRVSDSQQERIGRLDEQLRAASMLQRSLVRSVPTVRGASVRTIDRPAELLSGDICDVARIDESQVCITLADVTDHGLTSALLAAHLKHSLQADLHRADATGHVCPAQILTRANNELLESAPPDCQFITAVVAVFDEDTQVLRWARGGAPYPILLRHEQPARFLMSDGPLLGVVNGADFEIAQVQLEPGDLVIFHTDGLETYTPQRPDIFCSEVIESDSSAGNPLDALIRGIESRIASHDPTESAVDDLSVVVLRVAQPTEARLRPQDSRFHASRVPVPA